MNPSLIYQGVIVAVLWVVIWGLFLFGIVRNVTLDNVMQPNGLSTHNIGCAIGWTLAVLWVFGGAVGMFLFGATH